MAKSFSSTKKSSPAAKDSTSLPAQGALVGKNILLGVCGSIAAYKAAYLIRFLVKEGAEVKVIMSSSAHDFISPLTLSTLSKHPVLTDFIASEKEGTWNNHVSLGLWADLFLIAPLSAHTLGKMARGICDNLLLATYLSARCPVWVAPAMDLDMYRHGSTQTNLTLLKDYGNRVIEARHGELASGLEGQGRMAEPEEIMEELLHYFKHGASAAGLRVLITSGPTKEALDPVRFISNHSSGKMGAALADSFIQHGAQVIFIYGEGSAQPSLATYKSLAVSSTEEMYQACKAHQEEAKVLIFAAAVSDYRPKEVKKEKIKKEGNEISLSLTKNVDIAASLGKIKKKGAIHVGFALETEKEIEYAQQKKEKKAFDLIVLNSLKDEGAGFQHDTNKVKILDGDNKIHDFELKSKKEVAYDVFQMVMAAYHQRP